MWSLLLIPLVLFASMINAIAAKHMVTITLEEVEHPQDNNRRTVLKFDTRSLTPELTTLLATTNTLAFSNVPGEPEFENKLCKTPAREVGTHSSKEVKPAEVAQEDKPKEFYLGIGQYGTMWRRVGAGENGPVVYINNRSNRVAAVYTIHEMPKPNPIVEKWTVPVNLPKETSTGPAPPLGRPKATSSTREPYIRKPTSTRMRWAVPKPTGSRDRRKRAVPETYTIPRSPNVAQVERVSKFFALVYNFIVWMLLL
ncbi:uncharacterized protein KNAG_0A03190 [Huiozyma naganishii CBS 8797]|uniref:Uncharacterized protein n=1 Tax=Huiozyma naganishii (strain ATCC MYA-139 / BCRC 22969 / CBS 8797 / KCTC 17520 / NBRC 10181 / NCYC 3082 / Yp74L-3) TaxID=1071383 RepID=J7S3J4_HUIN7|nr:hypothetical protein KNAG_0A03190 [Kazachstania naganishii CBS 8797]CCK68006.1 hypothetical protein KNAG_0A03190 [Kazachstania naganishii CBS 8797]